MRIIVLVILLVIAFAAVAFAQDSSFASPSACGPANVNLKVKLEKPKHSPARVVSAERFKS
jgi:hypothetical protein